MHPTLDLLVVSIVLAGASLVVVRHFWHTRGVACTVAGDCVTCQPPTPRATPGPKGYSTTTLVQLGRPMRRGP